jgi:hypothetical protein
MAEAEEVAEVVAEATEVDVAVRLVIHHRCQ